MNAAEIAARLGLKRYQRSWRGDCPCCSYARAFSVRAGKQDRITTYCSNGCSHDVIDDALQSIAGGAWTPIERPDAETVHRARERKRVAAQRLFSGGAQLRAAGDCPALHYLASRHLAHLADSPALRWRTDVTHPD